MQQEETQTGAFKKRLTDIFQINTIGLTLLKTCNVVELQSVHQSYTIKCDNNNENFNKLILCISGIAPLAGILLIKTV